MGFQRILSGFGRDQSGATAALFGVAFMPVAISMAAAIDYSRVADFRTKMQVGVDSAALYLAKQPLSLNDSTLQQSGRPIFDAHAAPGAGYETSSFTAARDGRTIHVAAAGTVATAFGLLVGQSSVAIHAQADVATGNKKIELALVLDNTGSMSSRQKMQKLKEASNLLLDKLQAAVAAPDDVKVAIVPFDTQVRMPASVVSAPPSWIKFEPLNPASGGARASNWQGCVTDRVQTASNYDTNDLPPTPLATDSLYLASQCASGSLARVLPLTNNFPAMRTSIASMQPSGCTNVTIGAAWGLAMLSETAPFTAAAPLGDPDVQKIVVILTDGLNTKNRFVDTSGCSGSGAAGAIDARTRMACDQVLAAATPSTRIRAYAIRVIEGNEALLRNCAGNGGRYFDVQDPNDLSAVFQSIADEITRIRLIS